AAVGIEIEAQLQRNRVQRGGFLQQRFCCLGRKKLGISGRRNLTKLRVGVAACEQPARFVLRLQVIGGAQRVHQEDIALEGDVYIIDFELFVGVSESQNTGLIFTRKKK